MRKLLLHSILIGFVGLISQASANELQNAYQKEYAYLVAEKKALQDRLGSLKRSNGAAIKTAEQEIDSLQSDFLARNNQIERINGLLADASRDADFSDTDTALLQTTVLQAKEALEKNSINLDETRELDEQLYTAFKEGNKILVKDGRVTKSEGEFFGVAGEAVKGVIVTVGRISKFGVSDSASGVLAPAGEGKFKVWDGSTAKTAKLLNEDKRAGNIDVFLYDNPNVAMDRQDEKTISDDIEAGGLIGMIILGIGGVGLALLIARVMFLYQFSANVQSLTNSVNDAFTNKGLSAALEICKKHKNSASRVISSTLKNLNKERDHIEDIISESILHESSRIDRFGAMILVIAAVSPLLGLLGTVTGMISTFDIITEFGTGDPKLLSTGISEALITTKFGLVVAIPMLLIGNILSSWATRTKNDLERSALHMINTHAA